MKVEKVFNKKKGVFEYQARFQLGGLEFRPRALDRKTLKETIDEIRARQHRTKFELPVSKSSPRLRELFDIHLPRIKRAHQRKTATRVFNLFLTVNDGDLKILELKKTHFQRYIDFRLSQTGKQTGRKIQPQTVNKEIYAISSALKDAPLLFSALEDYRKPVLPKAKEKNSQRKRIVTDNELSTLLAELRSGTRTEAGAFYRERLADWIEFAFYTGLRRKEIARLKWSNYDAGQNALVQVRRWKTDTVTPFFPLAKRAREIIEKRREAQKDSLFIFTPDGEPIEAHYRTLKTVCDDLGINYGRYKENGFVMHDERHNFATNLIEVTDLETAKSLTGHTGTAILTYLHTNEGRQRDAIRKMEKSDRLSEIVEIYKAVRRGRMKLKRFVESVRSLS